MSCVTRESDAGDYATSGSTPPPRTTIAPAGSRQGSVRSARTRQLGSGVRAARHTRATIAAMQRQRITSVRSKALGGSVAYVQVILPACAAEG